MTLLLLLAAASAVTLIWYCSSKARNLRIGTLCLVYWGASLMWLVDTIAAYCSQGVAYFADAVANIRNDGFLGMAIVVLGFVIWLMALLIKDPEGTIHTALSKRN